MNLNHSYYYFKGAIPLETCNKIIKKYSKTKLKEGTTKGQKKNIRDSKVIFTSEPDLYDLIHPYIYTANQKAGWNFDWDFTEACQFTKYGLNQHYNWHQDGTPDPYPMDYANLNYRGKYRKLSTTISLSDGSKYTGGDFQIDLRDKNIDFTKKTKDQYDVSRIITLKELREPGTVIVMPSFNWHRVTPVLKGTRYSLVCWSLGYPWR